MVTEKTVFTAFSGLSYCAVGQLALRCRRRRLETRHPLSVIHSLDDRALNHLGAGSRYVRLRLDGGAVAESLPSSTSCAR